MSAPWTLLIDVGNTHSDMAIDEPKRPLRRRRWPTQALPPSFRAIEEAMSFPEGPCLGAVIASVAPPVNGAIRELLEAHLPSVAFVDFQLPGVVATDYPSPETIGADRLANATAAIHAFGAPAIVVDFGTAVTFDVVDERGAYTGGIIAPGLAAMTDYFAEKTALLPRIEMRPIDRDIGKSTEEAMLIGAVHGYGHMINGLLDRVSRALRDGQPQIVLTGGYAELISPDLERPHEIDPDLTLYGLAKIAEAQGWAP